MLKSARELVMEASTHVESLPPESVARDLASGEVVLIDVREPTEWEHHIAGAIQIPRGLIEFVADPECGPKLPPSLKFDLEPSQRVIVYCNSGARATLAALTLKNMGYENVANLDGGLAGWQEASLPVTSHHAGI